MKKVVVACICFIHISTAFSAHIVFDLGGIIVAPKKHAIASSIGYFNIVNYWLTTHQSPFTMQQRFFDLLQDVNLDGTKPHLPISNWRKSKLPPIITAWVRGDVPCNQLLPRIQNHLQEKLKTASVIENRIMQKLAALIFDQYQQATVTGLLPEGVNLVKKCYNSCDAQGNRNKLYILSNMNGELFDCLYKMHQQFFSLFDGIIVSGKSDIMIPASLETVEYTTVNNANTMKPEPAIYQKLLKNAHWELEPHETYFIDDQKENIEAAKKHGICGLYCPQPYHLKTAEKILIKKGALVIQKDKGSKRSFLQNMFARFGFVR